MGTGVLKLLGGEVENRCVRSGPDSYSVIGEANTQPPGCKQVLSECAIPTSRQNLVQIEYLNPNRMYLGAHARATNLNFPPKFLASFQGLLHRQLHCFKSWRPGNKAKICSQALGNWERGYMYKILS